LSHIRVSCKLPVRCFLWAPRRWISLGPILPTGYVTGYRVMAGRLWITLPTDPVSCPVISIYLNPLRITCLAVSSIPDNNVKQAVTSWLQTLDTAFCYTGIQALMSLWNQCLTLSARHPFQSFSTPCILNVNNTGAKQRSIMK
jgi:hypothetical protein